MNYDEPLPSTRRLLERIAGALNVPADSFFRAERAATARSGPSASECAQAVALFCTIRSPQRRTAALRMLCELAYDG